MANNEKISELIDQKAFQQLEALNKGLEGLSQNFADNIKSAAVFNDIIGKSGGVKEFQKASENAAKAIEKANNIQIQSREKVRLAEIRLEQAREKAFDKFDKQLAKEQASLAKSENLYNKVQAKVNALSATYNNLAIKQQLGLKLSTREEAQLLSLEKRLNTYQTALIKVDAQIQKNGRNVGNYASGFNPLNNAIGQISRELPNFGQSFQIGVLSLTNNIGALQDAISGIIAQNKILISQGAPTKSVFSQILGSVLSFNTGLFVAIGLFSAYSKEIGDFVSELFTFESRISALDKRIAETTRSQKEYNSVILEGAKNAQTEIVSVDLMRKSIENVNVPLGERNKLVDDLQKEYPKYFKNLTNEQILAGNVGNAYKLLKEEIIAASLARAAQDKIVENAQRQLDNEAKTLELRRQRIKAGRELEQIEKNFVQGSGASSFTGSVAVADEFKLGKARAAVFQIDKQIYDLQTDTNKLNADNLRLIQKIGDEVEKNGAGVLTGNAGALEDQKKINDGLLQLELFRAQNLASINEAIVSDTNKSEEERFAALEKSVQARQRVIELERKIALDNDDLTANDRIRIQEEFIAKSSQLTIDGNAEALAIAVDNISKQDKLRIEAQQKALNDISINRDNELRLLEKDFQSGLISKEEYEKKRLEIARFYSAQEILEQIKQTEAIIALQKSRGENVSDEEAQLAALRLKYSKEATDAQIEDLKRVEDAEKKLKELQKELAGELFNLTEGIFNAGFEKRLQGIDKEIERNEEKADFDREQVEDSIATEEEKEIRLAQIDANAQGKREQLEARQRQIQVQQARFQKASDAARIISQTSLAIISALAQVPKFDFGISAGAIAATYGAIGAAQLAQVLATPIPAFKHGKDKGNNYEGVAWVGDGMQSELVINPDGSAWVTPAVPTLTHVSKDTEILSGPELKKMLAFQTLSGNTGGSQLDSNGIIQAVKEQTGKTINAIKNSAGKGTKLTSRGLRSTHNTTNGFNEYISRNF